MRLPNHRPIRSIQAGFTLLEVLIVLGLMAVVGSSMVSGIRSWSRSELRGSATRIAGAIRYLFDRASTTGKVHRLVLDFETGKYWAEVSGDQFSLPRERETEEIRAREAEEKALEEVARKKAEEDKNSIFEKGDSAYDFSHYQPKEWKAKRAKFESFKELVLKSRPFTGGKMAALFTPRLAEPLTQGQGYIYFFPLGQTESALIHLADKDGTVAFSLMVHPLTGRVKVKAGYVEPPLREQFDDEGTVIE